MLNPQGRDDVATCLVTGNLEPIGWGKMAALGIEQLFTAPRFGGFGSDHCRCEGTMACGARGTSRASVRMCVAT
jgi:hypothetical protein